MTTSAPRETRVPWSDPTGHSGIIQRESWIFPLPAVLRCGLFILGLKVALRIAGFQRTLRWIEGRVRQVPTRAMARPEHIIEAQRAVAMAAALYPGRALCLEQSLALYYFLRCAGIGARLRLGVKPYPFEAHAWVEHDGMPVNDFAEHVCHFAPLPDLPL